MLHVFHMKIKVNMFKAKKKTLLAISWNISEKIATHVI